MDADERAAAEAAVTHETKREGGGAGASSSHTSHRGADEDSQWALLFNLADRSAGGITGGDGGQHASASTSTDYPASGAAAAATSPNAQLRLHPSALGTSQHYLAASPGIAAHAPLFSDLRFTPTWATQWDPFAMQDVQSESNTNNNNWQPITTYQPSDSGSSAWEASQHQNHQTHADLLHHPRGMPGGVSILDGQLSTPPLQRALFATSPSGYLLSPASQAIASAAVAGGGGSGSGSGLAASLSQAHHNTMDWTAALDAPRQHSNIDVSRPMVPGTVDGYSAWAGQTGTGDDMKAGAERGAGGAAVGAARSTSANAPHSHPHPPSLLDRRLQRNSRLHAVIEGGHEYPFPTSDNARGSLRMGAGTASDGPLRPYSTGPLDSSSSRSMQSGSPSTSASSASSAPAWVPVPAQADATQPEPAPSTQASAASQPSKGGGGPLTIARPKAKPKVVKPTERTLCEQCGKTFAKAAHAKRHQVVHTNDRGFACPECGATFSRADSRDRHLGRRHGQGAAAAASAATAAAAGTSGKGKRKASAMGDGGAARRSASASGSATSGSASGSATSGLARSAQRKMVISPSSASSSSTSPSSSLLPPNWRPQDLAIAAAAAAAAAAATAASSGSSSDRPTQALPQGRINRNVGFNAPPSPSASTAGSSATSSGTSSVASSPMMLHNSPRTSLSLLSNAPGAVAGPPRLTPTPLGEERFARGAAQPDGPGTPFPTDYMPDGDGREDDDVDEEEEEEEGDRDRAHLAAAGGGYHLDLPSFDPNLLRDIAQLPLRTPTPANLAAASSAAAGLDALLPPPPPRPNTTEPAMSMASMPVPVSVEQSLDDQRGEMTRGLGILQDLVAGAGAGAGGGAGDPQDAAMLSAGPLPVRDHRVAAAGGPTGSSQHADQGGLGSRQVAPASHDGAGAGGESSVARKRVGQEGGERRSSQRRGAGAL